MPAVHYLQLPQDAKLVENGMPTEGPAIVYDKGLHVFSSATNMLTHIIGDVRKEVEFNDDPEWSQFPEIGSAFKQVSGEELPSSVVMCASRGKWAVGFAPDAKGRQTAAKLALCLALEEDAERTNVAKKYPDYKALQAATNAAGGGSAPFEPEDMPEAASKKSSAGHPAFLHLSVPAESSLCDMGMPSEGLAVIHDKSMGEMFRQGHYILEELVGDVSTVEFKDDPDWKEFPDIAEALGQAGTESNCYCVAISQEFGRWAVGVGASWKPRESAAKLALCMTLAPAMEKLDALKRMYPDFGSLCDASASGRP